MMSRRHLALVAIAGAMIGAWLSPGRAYAAPVWQACELEDSVSCVWDAKHAGNGSGRSFYVRKSGRVVHVSHRVAHNMIGDAR